MASQDGNIVQALLGPVHQDAVQLVALGVLLPICLLRDFRFLTPVVKVGIAAVFAALGVVMLDGLATQGGLSETLAAVSAQPLWPASVSDYFKSLGSIIFLFSVNYLVLPIEQSMAQPSRFGSSVDLALIATGSINLLFAILGLSFFGDGTQDVVTNNLGPGNVLTIVKLLLVIDLALSYPLVMTAGREIMERAVVGSPQSDAMSDALFVGGTRAAVRAGLVALSFALAHAKGFGLITNIAGGLAQGVLALVVPPWMALKLGSEKMPFGERAACVALASVGVIVAASTTYEAILSSA
jgi:proton-coupled amino acid transporter